MRRGVASTDKSTIHQSHPPLVLPPRDPAGVTRLQAGFGVMVRGGGNMASEIRPGLGGSFDEYYEIHKQQGVELFGGYTISPDELRAELDAPGFDAEQMISLAREKDTARLTGFCEVRAYHEPPVRLYGFGYVTPAARGEGVGTRLVAENERIAGHYVSRCPEDALVVLQQFSFLPEAAELLTQSGYAHTRDSLTMEIAFGGAPEAPRWPQGTALYSLADGVTLSELVAVNQAAFADHRGAVSEPLETVVARWEHMISASKRVHDPALFVLAFINGAAAGVVATWTEDEDNPEFAFVQSLGVVPEYRRRGLGHALLLHAFSQAYAIGKRGAALSVDGASLTGADRLYWRAGMRVRNRIGVFEKEIRPGTEISRQS